MATIKQSEHGQIRLLHDFTGVEVYAPQVHHAASQGAFWNIGHGFTIKGDALNDAQALAVAVEDGLNGQVTFTSANVADGDAIYCTTETCFKPSVNAPMAVECRLEMTLLTARRVFVGFRGTMDDDESDVLTGSGSTLTLTAEADLVGFFYDVGLTTDIEWHMVHAGGTTTGVTDGLLLNSGVTPVINKMNILRVEVDNNGTARWFIDGVLLKTLAGAVAPTAVFAGCVGAIATSAVSATVTVDYIAVEAERDWTI